MNEAGLTDEQIAELVEKLADIEHERWARWQTYVHSKCKRQPDGTLVIPLKFVKRWERQIATPYPDLTRKEKESDRDQVRKYLPLVLSGLTDRNRNDCP